MGKWEMVRLGDVCEVVSGSTPSTKNAELWDGNIKWIAPAEISENSYFIYDTIKHISERAKLKLMPAGTVLLSSRAPIGKVAIAGTEMCCNQGFKNLICSDKIHNRYLYRYLKNQTEYLNSLGRGATFKEISKAIVENVTIPLPPLEVQQQIADLLDRASALIEKRKAQIDKLDLLVKAQFIEMFGDPVINPKGWEIGTIRDLLSDVKYGTSKPATEGGKHIYLRMNNITYEGTMDFSSLKYIDVAENEIEKYIVRKGDILFNRTNSKELVGKTAVFKETTPMVIAGYIIRVRTNEKAHPEYISAFLNSKHGKRLLFDMCKAIVGQANINAQELQNIKIPLAPISLQNNFAAFVGQVEIQKSPLKKSLALLELNYKSLMQKCFKEEIFTG